MMYIAVAQVHNTLVNKSCCRNQQEHVSNVDKFLNEFGTYLENTVISPGHLLMVGDFNFHVEDKTNIPARKFLDLLESFNLAQHVSAPTHSSHHTLDLIITRADDPIVFNVDTYDPAISDHKAITCSLRLNKPPALTKTINYRCLSKINIDKLLADLRESSLVNSTPDHLEELITIYNTKLTQLLDSHAPMKSKTITERENSKWFTGELGDLKREERAL